jgi:hypothetical protein
MNSKEVPELPVPATPERSRLGQAMRRVLPNHWGKILAIWAVLTAVVTYVIYVRVKPLYESASLLRVEPSTADLFGMGIGAEPFEQFLQTQVELIKSPSVLSAAIASGPKVSGTALLRGSRDPVSELRGRLQVRVLPGTYLIRVGLTTPEPADGPPIISEVVRAYLAVAAAWSHEKNHSQITRLEKYSLELWSQFDEKKREWIELTQKPLVDLQRGLVLPPSRDGSGAAVLGPTGVTIDEYRQIRQRLFETNLKLIETEALLKRREDEVLASNAGTDPELLAQRWTRDALRNDPEIAALLRDIDEVQRKLKLADYRARNADDPSRVHLSRQLETLKENLQNLVARKQQEIAAQPDSAEPSLRELNAQLDSLKLLKGVYEKLLSRLKLSNGQEKADEVKLALVREDLASLREMRASVAKRIEQLKFNAVGGARINEIDPAKPNSTPIKDHRRKLLALAPVVVLPLVLGLFLALELRSSRGTDRKEEPGETTSFGLG